MTDEVVKETVLWCHRAPLEGRAWRSVLETPDLMLPGRGSEGEDALAPERIAAVAALVKARHQKLSEISSNQALLHPSSELGRLLRCSSPSLSVYDGVARAISNGFFDENDLPPSDTWIAYEFIKSRWFLIAWIPADLVPTTQKVIDSSVVEAFEWQPW